jgi:hypothetical protein
MAFLVVPAPVQGMDSIWSGVGAEVFLGRSYTRDLCTVGRFSGSVRRLEDFQGVVVDALGVAEAPCISRFIRFPEKSGLEFFGQATQANFDGSKYWLLAGVHLVISKLVM